MLEFSIKENITVTKKIHILPCPFCDSESVDLSEYAGSWGYSSSKVYVRCLSCGATGSTVESNEGITNALRIKAIQMWNRREHHNSILKEIIKAIRMKQQQFYNNPPSPTMESSTALDFAITTIQDVSKDILNNTDK